MEEFFQQGDLEKESKLPLSFLCDRCTTHIPKSQVSFFEFCAHPLFKAWETYLQTPFSATLCHNILANKDFWNSINHLSNDQLPPTPATISSPSQHDTKDSSSKTTSTLTEMSSCGCPVVSFIEGTEFDKS